MAKAPPKHDAQSTARALMVLQSEIMALEDQLDIIKTVIASLAESYPVETDRT